MNEKLTRKEFQDKLHHLWEKENVDDHPLYGNFLLCDKALRQECAQLKKELDSLRFDFAENIFWIKDTLIKSAKCKKDSDCYEDIMRQLADTQKNIFNEEL